MERRPTRLLCFLFLLLAATSATAAQVRIHRAEPFTLPAKALPATGTLAKPHAATRTPLEFDAFGQSFALELQDNAELLARLPAERRKAIAARAQLYAGKLQGQPDSWVRVTRVGHDLHGLIFDGHEFYSIAPVLTLEPLLDSDALPVATAGNVIYRASDMEIDLDENFCSAVRKDQRERRRNGAEAYRAILDELATTAAAIGGPTREVEVGLLGDLEFFQRQGASSEDALISRFNIVDGIFTDQVDLRITVGSIRVLTGGANLFTTNDSGDLLDELSAYRRSNAALQAFGLTHLVTGRALDGRTIGIAFVEGVCDQYFGTSLSSDMGFDVTTSALVAAHELGHNFGADHDAETDSVCATTPDGYLMAPRISGSGTFSDCSLQTMEPVIASSACIFPARTWDAQLDVFRAPGGTTVRQAFNVTVPVRSVGNQTIDDVVLEVEGFGPGVSIVSATSTDGQCTVSPDVLCELGDIPPGEVREVSVRVRGEYVDTGSLVGQLRSARDDDNSNDRRSLNLDLGPRVDVSIAVDETDQHALLGEALTNRLHVTASGVEPALDVVFDTSLNGVFESVTASSGTCAVAAGAAHCSLGTLPVGETRTITLTYLPASVGHHQVSGDVGARYDDVDGNQSVAFFTNVAPRKALGLSAEQYEIVAEPDRPASFAFVLESTGPLAINDTVVQIDFAANLQVLAVTADGSVCASVPASRGSWACQFPTLASGTRAHIEAVVQGDLAAYYPIIATAISPENENPDDPRIVAQLRVQQPYDVRVVDTPEFSVYDHRSAAIHVQVFSEGQRATSNVRVEIALPEYVIIETATSAGICTIESNTASCTIETLQPADTAEIDLQVRADTVGQYYGTATVFADDDRDARNDQVTLGISVLPAFDVSLEAPDEVRFVTGEATEFTVWVRSSTQPIDGATFSISPSDLLEVELLETDSGECYVTGCAIDALPAAGSARVTIRARAGQAGFDSLLFRVSMRTDVDVSNNSKSVTVQVEDPPPPTPPPPPTDPGDRSSSGGGRTDIATLVGLSLLAVAMRRRRVLATRLGAR